MKCVTLLALVKASWFRPGYLRTTLCQPPRLILRRRVESPPGGVANTFRRTPAPRVYDDRTRRLSIIPASCPRALACSSIISICLFFSRANKTNSLDVVVSPFWVSWPALPDVPGRVSRRRRPTWLQLRSAPRERRYPSSEGECLLWTCNRDGSHLPWPILFS